MGTVRAGTACSARQGSLALASVGRLEPDEELELNVHLDTCPGCQIELAELAGVADVLSLVGADAALCLREAELTPVHADQGPRGSAPTVLPTGRQRRIRPALVAAGAGLAAAVAAALLAVLSIGPPAGPGRVVALSGGGGVRASATLTPRPGGTRVVLVESGQSPGQVFTVTMRSKDGGWWTAGSYRSAAAGHQLTVELTCAAAERTITAVWVTDRSGHTVLSGSPT